MIIHLKDRAIRLCLPVSLSRSFGEWLFERQQSFLLALISIALAFVLRTPFWSRPFDIPPATYFLNALVFSISSPQAVNIHVCAARLTFSLSRKIHGV
jgi:hypothetical protein